MFREKALLSPALATTVTAGLAVVFASTVVTLGNAHYTFEDRIVQLHAAIVAFGTEGQSTVELLAPLSATHYQCITDYTKALIDKQLLWPFLGALLWTTSAGQRPGHYLRDFMWIGALIFAFAWYGGQESDESLLSKYGKLADSLLILAVLVASVPSSHVWIGRLRFYGLGEMLTLAGFGFGCNYTDAAMAYFLLTVSRAGDFAKRLAKSRISSARLACEGILSLFLHLLICPMLALFICGSLLPQSEVASGGNHNLRFLSPDFRAHITPFPALSPRDLLLNQPYTFYTPSAGFLWSDNLVWKLSNRQLGIPDNDEEDDEDPSWRSDGSMRVYYHDKFVRRYPWTIEQFGHGSRRDKGKQTLQSDSTVQVYDPTADRYLCVIAGERVVSEAIFFNNGTDTRDIPITRFRVGTLPDSSSVYCHWNILYDPHNINQGISLYSNAAECSLSTNYRSLTHLGAPETNDTVSRTLSLRLEASCTSGANTKSSRIYMIDQLTDSASTPLTPSEDSYLLSLWWGIEYFRARHNLASFRRTYAWLQDLGEMEQRRPLRSFYKPNLLLSSMFCAVWPLTALARRRRLLQSQRQIVEAAGSKDIPGFFVSIHLVVHYFHLHKALVIYPSRAAGLISLYSLMDLLRSFL